MRHVLKLVWNRKRANALLILEIFFAFLVVFVVLTLGAYCLDSYGRPLGYDYQDVWTVEIDQRHTGSADNYGIEERIEQLLAELRSFGEIEAADAAVSVPFEATQIEDDWETLQGRSAHAEMNEAGPELAEVLRLELVAGRWFERADAALPWRPAVLDQEMSRELFGDVDPIGQKLVRSRAEPPRPEYRVVGVISDFRRGGELSAAKNHIFQLLQPGQESFGARHFVIRVAPGTSAELEESIAARLQAIAPEWAFRVYPLSRLRETSLRFAVAPMAISALVGAFLLLMVALGLSGVLWQNVVCRTRELGLRRAVGASRGDVRLQLLLEVVFMSALGLGLGTVVVLQVPLLGILGFLPVGVFTLGFGMSLLTILGLAAACALVPARIASRIPPAVALHYE
jgi:putative ABC transport system permease protein